MERQGGCLPRWPYATQNTNVMNGDPSSPIIATAYALGVRGFDARAALRAMVKGADRPCRTENGDYTEREALSEYLDLGWIPHELNVSAGTRSLVDRKAPWGTAATSLEYAIADFSVSRLAEALGRERLALRFRERAANWRNLVNPGNTAIEPRMSDGTFAPGVTPESEDGFVEGSSAQYGWLVPHDMAGRIATLGGRKEALSNLNRFFTELNAGPASAYAFLGNEPTLHTPWIYNWLGNPARAQAVVRRAQIELFGPGPGGLPGNDDGGTMSAWYVLSSLGLSPVIPGTDVMPLGSPLFPRAVVEAGGRSLRFFSPHAARNRPYVRSLRIDGRPWPRPWLRLSRLGPETRFDWSLSGKPSRWAISRRFSPPSFPPSP
jgi:predicted alpha-1,2-mannosidase